MPRPAKFNRDAALHSAMTLFWDRGYHATSLKDLEAELNMKPGSIYAAFNSKQQLYSDAMHRYFESARESFRGEIASAPTPLTGLANHIRSYVKDGTVQTRRQLCMLIKTSVDTQTTEPALSQQAHEHLNAMCAEFAAVFEDAKKKGELSLNADSVRLAQRYQANLNALRLELHQDKGREGMKSLAEDIAQEIECLQPWSRQNGR